MKISKKVRLEASHVCAVAASSDPAHDGDPIAETIALALDVSHEAGQLADEAANAVGLSAPKHSLRECFAEAGLRLQEGWTP